MPNGYRGLRRLQITISKNKKQLSNKERNDAVTPPFVGIISVN